MAVRQYIGARYVPLYVGDWDNNRSYEPLSIVTDANGNSYTSLRDVPAGTPLRDDRTFWVQTSSFSGAVDRLRRDLNQAQNDLSVLDGRVDSAESDIATIKTTIQNLKNRKVIFVGDSYLGLTAPTWADGFLSAAPYITAHQIIYHDGIGFANDGGSAVGLRFADLFANATLTIPANEVTDIILIGGVNDSLQTDQAVRTGLSDFYNTAVTKCPNAMIYIGMAGLINNPAQESALRTRILPIMQSANAPKLFYLNGVENINHNYALLADNNRHPSPAVNNAIGAFAAKAWKSGFADYSAAFGFTVVSNPYNQESPVSVIGNITQKNDRIDITVNPPSGSDFINVSWGRGITLQPNALLILFGIGENRMIAVEPNRSPVFMVTVRLYRDAGLTQFDTVTANAYINNNNIEIKLSNAEAIQYGFGIGVSRIGFSVSTNQS